MQSGLHVQTQLYICTHTHKHAKTHMGVEENHTHRHTQLYVPNNVCPGLND